jgi:hypothetical protein
VPERLRWRICRSQDVEGDRHVAPLGEDGQAEVGERRLAEPAEQDVGRLDVAVQHAEGVRVGQRVGDLEPDIARLDRGQRGVAHALGIGAVAQFHDQVWVAAVGHPGVEQVDDVRVAGHPAGRTCFTQEPAPVPLGLQRAILHLDRDVAPDRLLHCPVDGGIAAPGQHGEPGQAGHRGQGGRRGHG